MVSPLRQFLAVIYSTTFYIPPSRPLVAGQLLFSIPPRRLAAWMAVYAVQGRQNAMKILLDTNLTVKGCKNLPCSMFYEM